MINPSKLGLILLFVAMTHVSQAAVTKVGNGDDGRDLEGFEPLTEGPIVESRKKAVELLSRLNVNAVRGLGNLIPEVEKSELYMAKKNVEAIEGLDLAKYHSNISGMVYARTFAEPHAPTRFFPISKQLDENQLVSLHIHEALHRALPASVRENEDIVSSITLAITSPGATFDRVNTVAETKIPKPVETQAVAYDDGRSFTRRPIPEDADVKRPSMFRYSYRQYNKNQDSVTRSKFRNMHTVESFLFPFGSDENPIGVGAALSIAGTDKEAELGPLALSGRMKLWSARGFDVGAWAEIGLNTLSNEDLKNSPYGRDLLTLGLSARRDASHFYIENILGYTFESKTDQEIGSVKYQHEYGAVTTVKVRSGAKLSGFALGGFGEILLSDFYKVSGGAFKYDSGRFNIVSVGPELSYTAGNFTTTLFGRFIISRTKDATYDSLGNLLGIGAGDGFVGGSLAISL